MKNDNCTESKLITELLDFVENQRENERDNERETERLQKLSKFNKGKNSKNDFKLLEDGFYMAKCEVCNLKFKLSCRYSGEFPLCTSHRDLNSRGNLKRRGNFKIII